MTEPNRLFFALWPDEATRAACSEAARGLKLRMQPGGRLTAPERYHLTLAFLGDRVPPEHEAAARQVAHLVSSAPFTLTLDQAMSFRKREIPWFLAPRESPPELQELHDALREALRQAGVAPERMRFAPHLTVLRNAGQMLPPTSIRPVAWPVREFVLMRSVLTRQPPEYEVLGRWPLTGSPGVRSRPAQMNLWDN